MSYFGLNGIGKLFLGGTEIAKAYLGTQLVYQSGENWGELERVETEQGVLSNKLLSSYDSEDYSYYNLTNPANAYTSATSSYAQIDLTRGASAETYIYFKWDTSSIPQNAVIDSVSCAVRIMINNTTAANVSARQVQMCSGTTLKGSAANATTTAADRKPTAGTWTREELNDARLRLFARRGASNTTSNYYFRLYYGKLTVNYTVEQYYYMIKVRAGSTTLTSREYKAGKTGILTLYGTLPSGFSILDNDVDVTSQLVQDGNNHTYTLSNIAAGHRVLMSHPVSCYLAEDGVIDQSVFSGKSITVIGDSISTFDNPIYKYDSYRMYYPKGNVQDVGDTWWKMLIEESGATFVRNLAYSGSSAGVRSDYPNYPSLYDRASLIGDCDLVIVALGTNDWPLDQGDYEYDTPIADLTVSEFRPAYIKGIKQLLATSPNVEIVCVALYMNDACRESIETIANHYGLTFINVGNDYTMISGDVPHPNKAGMVQIKNILINA